MVAVLTYLSRLLTASESHRGGFEASGMPLLHSVAGDINRPGKGSYLELLVGYWNKFSSSVERRPPNDTVNLPSCYTPQSIQSRRQPTISWEAPATTAQHKPSQHKASPPRRRAEWSPPPSTTRQPIELLTLNPIHCRQSFSQKQSATPAVSPERPARWASSRALLAAPSGSRRS